MQKSSISKDGMRVGNDCEYRAIFAYMFKGVIVVNTQEHPVGVAQWKLDSRLDEL